jgi:hypothetical protein
MSYITWLYVDTFIDGNIFNIDCVKISSHVSTSVNIHLVLHDVHPNQVSIMRNIY